MSCFLVKPLQAQQTNMDWAVSGVGPVLQLVTNTGHFGKGLTNYSGFFGGFHQQSCMYPAGSGIEYGVFALWIGAEVQPGGKRLVSTGGPWRDDDNNTGHHGNRHELFPSAEPWDTVWVVERGETVDIPFWGTHTGISDQDLVCHYNDYIIKTIPEHEPMFIDIVQITYAWTSLEFLVHQFWIIPRQNDLANMYVGLFGNMQIGDVNTSSYASGDEWGSFDDKRIMGFIEDLPEGNDTPLGPIAFKIFPDVPENELRWTWHDGNINTFNVQEPPSTDEERFRYMKAGINHDPLQGNGYGHFLYDTGPFEARVGDTLHITIGQILGKGKEGVFQNYDRLVQLRNQDYRTPAPPPRPPLRIAVGNHQATLDWEVRPGNVNPETYTDEYRADGEPEPFAGYRVYKSTVSINGPWVLLAEYDRTDDPWDNNIGLAYSYVDVGLLNNLEYYYSVTAFSKPDTVFGVASLESGINANAKRAIPGTASPETVGRVAVVPNPYRGDEKYYTLNPAWEKPSFGNVWREEDRRIQFINLPSPCTITVYTVSGKFVTSIQHDNPDVGFENWNLTSSVGQAIASGVYLFTVKDSQGNIQTAKFVVIK